MSEEKKEVERFKDLWASYSFMVIPNEACDEQIKATKYAFYSGAFGIMSILTSLRSTNLEEQGKEIGLLFDEINKFIQEVSFDAITKGKKTGTA